MQELTLPGEEGKTVLYPRMRLWQQAGLDEIAAHIQQASTFSKGEIIGLVQELARQIAYEMSQGKSVKIDGLGIFTPALGLREGRERETGQAGTPRRNAASICLRGVNFRADKQLVQDTARTCTLERASLKFRRSSARFTPGQRLELAQTYLAKHPYLRVADYGRLTGLLPNAASKELRQWAARPDTGIAASGRGTHKVYVKRETGGVAENKN